MSELPGLAADRLKRAIAAFVRELFPQQDYFGFYLYSVASWNNGAQLGDLVPASTTSGLPALGRVPIRLPGLRVNLAIGQEVLVGFDNHDPTRPYIAHLGTLGTGLAPLSITVDSSGEIDLGQGATLGVARKTDSVACGFLTAAAASGVVTLNYVPQGGGSPIPILSATGLAIAATPVPIAGEITESSDKVKAA